MGKRVRYVVEHGFIHHCPEFGKPGSCPMCPGRALRSYNNSFCPREETTSTNHFTLLHTAGALGAAPPVSKSRDKPHHRGSRGAGLVLVLTLLSSLKGVEPSFGSESEVNGPQAGHQGYRGSPGADTSRT